VSLWNLLPRKLHGALWEPDQFYGYSQWHWVRGDQHEMERRSSTDWALYDPMAEVMRMWWSWWTLTERDQALRANEGVRPWKMGDAWVWVGTVELPPEPLYTPEEFEQGGAPILRAPPAVNT